MKNLIKKLLILILVLIIISILWFSLILSKNTNNYKFSEGKIWPTHIFVPYVNEMRKISGSFSEDGAMNLEKIYDIYRY